MLIFFKWFFLTRNFKWMLFLACLFAWKPSILKVFIFPYGFTFPYHLIGTISVFNYCSSFICFNNWKLCSSSIFNLFLLSFENLSKNTFQIRKKKEKNFKDHIKWVFHFMDHSSSRNNEYKEIFWFLFLTSGARDADWYKPKMCHKWIRLYPCIDRINKKSAGWL